MRISKVRRTDYRPPPTAGKNSALEVARLTRGGSVPRSEAAEHDKMVALFDEPTLLKMREDLASRRLKFALSPENRWAAARLEAIERRLNRKGVRP